MKSLWAWLVELDRILRGETTRLADLRDGKLRFPLLGILLLVVVLAMLAGACTGTYAVVNHQRPMQMLLRPFIGDPHSPVQFFREDTWGNAYLILLEMLWRNLGG